MWAVLAVHIAVTPLAAPNAPYVTLGWQQSAAALAEAQKYVYRYYLDGAPTGAVMAAVVCKTGTGTDYDCEGYMPQILSSGQHTVTLTSEISPTWRSGPSQPLTWVHVPVTAPAAPTLIVISK